MTVRTKVWDFQQRPSLRLITLVRPLAPVAAGAMFGTTCINVEHIRLGVREWALIKTYEITDDYGDGASDVDVAVFSEVREISCDVFP